MWYWRRSLWLWWSMLGGIYLWAWLSRYNLDSLYKLLHCSEYFYHSVWNSPNLFPSKTPKMAQFLIVTVGISPFEFYICILIFTFVNTATEYFVSYPWLKIITQIIKHNLGNRMLGQARPNSIPQAMIYNLGYDL